MSSSSGNGVPVVGLVIAVIVVAVLAVTIPNVVEVNDAGNFCVKQSVFTGNLEAISEPGPFWQMFGKVTSYTQADTYYFVGGEVKEKKAASGTFTDAILVRFNDGATARINGSVRFDIPADPVKLAALHNKFRNYSNVVRDGIQPLVSEAIILTAALMSAEESYTTKRSLFAELAQDQVMNGVYLTERAEEEYDSEEDGRSSDSVAVVIMPVPADSSDKDKADIEQKNKVEIAKGEKDQKDKADAAKERQKSRGKRTVVKIKLDKITGQLVRRQNPLEDYGIRLSQFTIQEVDYEATVDSRIQKKQEALMATVQAKAEAEKAVQQRLTAVQEGLKDVAIAEYEALKIKKTAVIKAEEQKLVAETSAEKDLSVAKLKADAAEQYKREILTKAEADSEGARKRLAADNQLSLRLNMWLEAQKVWAKAMADTKVSLVPSVVSGGGGNSGNAALNFMEIIGAKAAHDLGVSLSSSGK